MQIKRQVKEGNFRDRRHGETGARGDFRVEQLVALDADGKKEARRLGMATSDDEESGDENATAGNVDEIDSNDEMDQAIKMRHFGHKMTGNNSDESSDDSDVEELVNTAPGIHENKRVKAKQSS